MEYLSARLSIYIIPPLLSIILGWSLAAVSLIKGRFRIENILFSLVCIWWTLMPLIFFSHHLFKGNIELIMKVERTFHFLYVYMPAIILLYLQKSFALNKKHLVIASFILSFFISLFVPTEYYISGLYTYSWGYSAKGGIVFIIFATTALMHVIYIIWFFIRKVRDVKNFTERLKLKYILLSFIASGILMIFNAPAINGVDFYAYGNFMFIPLTLIAYGVLRYRLMDIKSVLHITLIWGIISSAILVPNILIFNFIKPHIVDLGDLSCFLFLVAWFLLNYFYFKKIKPVIDRVFKKQKFDLVQAEIEFAENISYLKTLGLLIESFSSALIKNLCFNHVTFYICNNDNSSIRNNKGEIDQLTPELFKWFIADDRYVEVDMVLTNPYYLVVRDDMLELFKRFACSYIIPLVRNNEMVGISFAGERSNLAITNRDESKFIESIKRSMAIAISNSVMYQNLSDLKDKLEEKVTTRTEELTMAMKGLESVNMELVATNEELSETRRMAEIDMQMAVNVQKSIFPEIPSGLKGWDIAAAFMPMSMVSGDLYDFYIEDELKGIILLDVSGHGIASGLITMIARSVFQRNFFMHRNLKLGKVVENANKELINEIGNTDKFLTGIILRFEDNFVEYVNAGHPDIMLHKKNSDVVKIINPSENNFKGSILGISGMDFPYKSLKFKIESGDMIALFSDGITEALGSDKSRFGIRRIEKSMIEYGKESSGEVLKKIMSDFYTFTGSDKLTDDLTIIIMKRR